MLDQWVFRSSSLYWGRIDSKALVNRFVTLESGTDRCMVHLNRYKGPRAHVVACLTLKPASVSDRRIVTPLPDAIKMNLKMMIAYKNQR